MKKGIPILKEAGIAGVEDLPRTAVSFSSKANKNLLPQLRLPTTANGEQKVRVLCAQSARAPPHHPISYAGVPKSSWFEKPRAIINREKVRSECQQIWMLLNGVCRVDWNEKNSRKVDCKKPPRGFPSWAVSRWRIRRKRTPRENNPNFWNKLGVVFQGGSSSSVFFIWKPPKKEYPLGGGVSFNQSSKLREARRCQTTRVPTTWHQNLNANGNQTQVQWSSATEAWLEVTYGILSPTC